MAKEPEKVCLIDAPCKINLHLGIGDRRPDGFHNLESLFACLALSDSLRFERAGNEGECLLSVDSEGSFAEPGGEGLISPENNLVYKAVSLFRERTGYADGLKVRLSKRIPVGAGLGGGSSDAASSLLAMNFLAGNPVSAEELREMAAVLGSDVPFFLSGGLAYVSGCGERIEPVVIPNAAFFEQLAVVLVKPPFSADTAAAYRRLDQARENGAFARASSGREMLPKETLIRCLAKDPITWHFYNDFLPVDGAGVYETILGDLRKAGASFASLSGSGSCCFGIFTSKETAEKVANNLMGQRNFIKLTFFLAHKAKPVVK